MKPKSACVIVFDDWPNPRHLLAVSRKDNPRDWGLPGGKIEAGEQAKTAASRELWEETGLIVVRNNLSKIYTGPAIVPETRRYECSVTFLVHKYRGEPIRREAGRVAWKTWEELFRGTWGDYNRALWSVLAERSGRFLGVGK